MQMLTVAFILMVTLLPVLLSAWAFRMLPDERWQMLAAVPLRKRADGTWQGVNLTYYGLFNAIAYTAAAGLAFVLLAAVGLGPRVAVPLLAVLIAICASASRLVAGLVEKKKHTLTVGGASFVGILLAPWLLAASGWLVLRGGGSPIPHWPVLAALAIAYAFGEGIGRLACISFGCCYGRPVATLPPRLQGWLRPIAFRFEGATRKVSYAGGLEHEPLIPVQAFTNLLYLAAGATGILLFLAGWYVSACLVTLAVTQLWRIGSEFLRADYRGEQRFSAYQRMSLASLLYAALLPLVLAGPEGGAIPDLAAGLAAIATVPMLLFLQGLFVFAFLFTGCSSVTSSIIAFGVNRDRI